jgi:hypothetical protein
MSDHYPLITQLDAAGVVHESTEAKSDGRGRTIFVEPKRTAKCDPAWLVPRIVDAVKAGAMVAVICNTVKAAQQLAFQLEGRLPEKVDLFHSRFTLLDRKVHETAGFTDPRVTVLLEEEEGRYGDVAVVYENWLPLWHTEQLLLEVARTHAGKLDSSKGNGREAENIRCWVERAYGGIDASVPEHVRTRHADWDKERKAWCETAERNISRKLGCNERKR